MNQQDIRRLADWIRQAKRIVFFGGAGVSTESGVKDYRSKDGIYQTVKDYSVSPETILSRDFFEEHPDVFYDFHYRYFLNIDAAPNAAHKVLAALEEQGKIAAVITQNIDGLHQAAGSRRVLELHGTVSRHYCADCKCEMETAAVKALGGAVPRCPQCGGVVRPDVVLYGEALPRDTVDQAVEAILSADMLIVGGTSLAVYPAAGFLRYFGGEHLVILNRDETLFDAEASLVLRDPIGEVMAAVMDCLESDDAGAERHRV